MILYEEQMELFALIGKNISRDIECYAFGGTAMMFYGYKDEKKDIDLVLDEEAAKREFIKALERLGYEKTSALNIYAPEKLKDKHAPAMYRREDSRFDIFSRKIFKTILSPKMKEDVYAVHDFKHKHNLRLKVLRKEHIVMLKAVTERKNDFDDIRTIAEKEKSFDWQYLTDEAIWHYRHGDKCVLLDVEKMMRELKQHIFIEKKYLKQLYDAHG